MSNRKELMKSRMRAKLLAAQTEDEEDNGMEIDDSVPAGGTPTQLTPEQTRDSPAIHQEIKFGISFPTESDSPMGSHESSIPVDAVEEGDGTPDDNEWMSDTSGSEDDEAHEKLFNRVLAAKRRKENGGSELGMKSGKRVRQGLSSGSGIPGKIVDPETKVRYYPNPYYKADPTGPFHRSVEFLKQSEPSYIPRDRDGEPLTTTEDLIDLYASLDLYNNYDNELGPNDVNPKFRLDSVLIRGTKNLSSDDIFEYLHLHNHHPTKLEWVNDAQCIVIFDDNYGAGACLLRMSKPIERDSAVDEEGVKRKPQEINYELSPVISSSDLIVPMPLSHVWRYAIPTHKNPAGILMTVPKRSDRKQENAELVSEYYRKHGNPNRGDGVWTKRGYERTGHEHQYPSSSANLNVVVKRYEEAKPPMESRLNFGRGLDRKRSAWYDEEVRGGPAKQGRSSYAPIQYGEEDSEEGEEEAREELGEATCLMPSSRRIAFPRRTTSASPRRGFYRYSQFGEAEDEFGHRSRSGTRRGQSGGRGSIHDRLGW